jgi:hypothetical protein
MSDVFDPAPAASILANALRRGVQLAELPAEIRTRTLSQGYDVQDPLLSLLGKPVAAWKLGVGTPSAATPLPNTITWDRTCDKGEETREIGQRQLFDLLVECPEMESWAAGRPLCG